MATLTETAYLTRKLVNLGAIVLVLLIILKISFGVVVGLWQKIFPPPPPPATVAFGKLPQPLAQNSVATPSGSISYSLETPDGGLPYLAANLPVYFMPRPGPSFGSFDRMKAQAEKLGFTDIPQRVSGTAWRYLDKETPLRVLDIDEVSGNFRLTYNYLSDLSLFSQKDFGNQEQIVSMARSFFGGLGQSMVDSQKGAAELSYFRLEAGALAATTSLSNADAVGVTFNRPDIKGFPVVSPDPKQGLVSILFSGASDQKKRVLEARFFYTAVDLGNWATYPLKGSQEAWDLLKSGRAIVASLPAEEGVPTAISIRKAYIAYLDPYPPQSYLAPVMVFSDEKGFMAYVPLVSAKWLE